MFSLLKSRRPPLDYNSLALNKRSRPCFYWLKLKGDTFRLAGPPEQKKQFHFLWRSRKKISHYKSISSSRRFTFIYNITALFRIHTDVRLQVWRIIDMFCLILEVWMLSDVVKYIVDECTLFHLSSQYRWSLLMALIQELWSENFNFPLGWRS